MDLSFVAVPHGYQLRIAESIADMESFQRLAQIYQTWLNVDLCFQNFQAELADLPGCYAAPEGAILLVSCARTRIDVGCVAVRPLLQSSNNSNLTGGGCGGCNTLHDTTLAQCSPWLNSSSICEMKRLWVDQDHQKSGLGKLLVSVALHLAKQMGYKQMVLDTLNTLTAANRYLDLTNRLCCTVCI
jgi:GNAT superfamily N-acetyltransferase